MTFIRQRLSIISLIVRSKNFIPKNRTNTSKISHIIWTKGKFKRNTQFIFLSDKTSIPKNLHFSQMLITRETTTWFNVIICLFSIKEPIYLILVLRSSPIIVFRDKQTDNKILSHELDVIITMIDYTYLLRSDRFYLYIILVYKGFTLLSV